jgi:hypothetical protein
MKISEKVIFNFALRHAATPHFNYEDEFKVAAFLRQGLEEQFYATEVANNG